MLYDFFCFFKQKTAYEMRISDWSSDVCSSDLILIRRKDRKNEKQKIGLGRRVRSRDPTEVDAGIVTLVRLGDGRGRDKRDGGDGAAKDILHHLLPSILPPPPQMLGDYDILHRLAVVPGEHRCLPFPVHSTREPAGELL